MFKVCFLFFLAIANLSWAEVKLTWYGHSAFKIETEKGEVLLIDPWINNPTNRKGYEEIRHLDRVDFILITHGHDDHVGDAVDIAKRTGANLVCTYDLGHALIDYQKYPRDQALPEYLGNFGGKATLFDGDISVYYVPALHSSGVVSITDNKLEYGGTAGGFLIVMKNGPTIYHTGDTDIFSDMTRIPKIHDVDIMLVCIGGFYTMGPRDAAEAVKMIRPKVAIPMHYGTFPLLKGTPQEFSQELQKQQVKTKMVTLQVGVPFSWGPSK